ncbi:MULTISPECIES: PLP-dependent aminotransferase family protein [Allobacillus]|uniref:PLP-dependent aminotransferase family protein n=1 Tax=Allobacillus salarius TaxID=1955272 RepID=A0A556PN21_9BACI|nr:PLP-dependent aminotransferase family protein [Allobacillus salarius]TSJ65796.1 PLP-dependent aminotransferase family protein [Allobacillus salarius]
MNPELFFTKNTKAALQNDPPGEWMPPVPKYCIPLSAGYPAQSLVPYNEMNEAVKDLIEEEKDLPFQYLGSKKVNTVKKFVRERLVERGVVLLEKEILVTAGAIQGIDLISRTFIDRDTWIVVESPSYMEGLEVFRNYTDHFITVPIDEYGMQTEELEKTLKNRKEKNLPMPKLVYTIPSFHNPTGTTMSIDRRRHLLELASEFNFLIIEDDAYGELYFDERPTPIKAMDSGSRVFYLGSFSKTIAPGLRVGYVAARSDLIEPLAWFKKDLDHPFAEATLGSYLIQTDMKKRFEMLRKVYQQNCKTLISSLEKYMGELATWQQPSGGYFVWVNIPGINTSEILVEAMQAGVSYVPGKHFFVHEQEGLSYLRLSFSFVSREEMVSAVEILSQVVKKHLNN